MQSVQNHYEVERRPKNFELGTISAGAVRSSALQVASRLQVTTAPSESIRTFSFVRDLLVPILFSASCVCHGPQIGVSSKIIDLQVTLQVSLQVSQNLTS